MATHVIKQSGLARLITNGMVGEHQHILIGGPSFYHNTHAPLPPTVYDVPRRTVGLLAIVLAAP